MALWKYDSDDSPLSVFKSIFTVLLVIAEIIPLIFKALFFLGKLIVKGLIKLRDRF